MDRITRTLFTTLALAMLLVACSAGAAAPSVASLDDPADGASPSPSASIDPEQARLDFARCMREHGIDMPDPGSGPARRGMTRLGTSDAEKMQAAMEACREQFEGVMGEGPQELTQEQRDAMLAFAQCMREHGIDMPDPNTSGGGLGIQIAPGSGTARIDPESSEFQEAQEACDDLLGDFGPGGGLRIERGTDVAP
jgi:hypothetical protein